MAGPIQRYEALLGESEFVFIVYFRGHWCPFCMAYLKDFQELVPSIKAAHGSSIIVTAETEQHLADTLAKTHFAGNAITDPRNELAATLKDRGLLHVAISSKRGYAQGMAQPAVLVQKKDGTVLYSWAISPGMMNLGGAKDRVALQEVWEDVQAMLKGQLAAPRAHYSTMSFRVGLKEKLFG